MAKIFGYKEHKFDFIGRKKTWYIIALLAIVPGLLMLLVAGMNLGIDFTGGYIFKIEYTEPVDLAELRETVSNLVVQTPSVNESGENSFVIRTEALTEEQSSEILDALGTLGVLVPSATEQEFIGPTIGAELLRNARWALLIAGVLMLLYITFRFKFNFALTAIAALTHDVLVIISVFTIFRIEVSSAFVAAILTTVGYSINNTIVIFDRIRENEGSFSRKEFNNMVNTSINQTLGRTINTVLAVLFLLLSLLIFGGETTKSFILALTVGMFAGFFSSVFLVGNILCDITRRFGNREKSYGNAKKSIKLRRNLAGNK